LRRALLEGRERDAALLLRRAAAAAATARERARFERWSGLLLIASGREVEGSLAVERAEARLDLLNLPYPTLESLLEQLGLEPDDLAET